MFCILYSIENVNYFNFINYARIDFAVFVEMRRIIIRNIFKSNYRGYIGAQNIRCNFITFYSTKAWLF